MPPGIEIPEERQQISDSIRFISDRFQNEWWLKKELRAEFPCEFHDTMAEAGWLGITTPEEYGGANLGVTDAALLMRIIGSPADAMTVRSSILISLFSPRPMVKPGTREPIMSFISERLTELRNS